MTRPSREQLTARLNLVPCSERLTPVRLWALQRLADAAIDEQIDRVIVQPLAALETGRAVQPYRFTPETLLPDGQPTIPSTCAEQFIHDLCVYGLREAIVYMSSYAIDHDIAGIVDQAVVVYQAIASSYVAHEKQLVASEDEAIGRLITRMGEAGSESSDNSQCDVPSHPFASELNEEMFGSRPSLTRDRPTQVADLIRDSFMFDEFPGYIQGIYQVATIMRKYGIDPQGTDGQQVLTAYIADITDELFGDFNRYVSCQRCGSEFAVEVSLAFANHLLRDSVFCASCTAALTNTPL